MMAPPTCPITGKHIRYLLLLGFLSYVIYFIVHGLEEPPSSRTVHICNTGDELQMIQCTSTNDVTTCANVLDLDGNEATCIQSSCGYRLFPHIDISIAGSSDPYDANGGASPTSFLSVVSILYSLVPYLLGFVYLVLFLAFGSLVSLTRFVVLGVIAVVNEGVFKQLVRQNRPEGSCLYFLSFGMPSGHAATSIGLLAYLLLECFVYHPNVLCGLTCQRRGRGEGGCAYSFQLGYGWQKQSNDENDSSGGPNDIVDDSVAIDINDEAANGGEASSTNMAVNEASTTSPQPLLDKNEESHVQSSATSTTSPPSPMIAFFRGKWLQHWCALGYIILLVPVPLSRVYLHDHLRNQVGYGALIGIAASMIWYLVFVRTCGTRVLRWRMSEWGKWWGLSL